MVQHLRAKGPDLVVPGIKLTCELVPTMCPNLLTVLTGWLTSCREVELTDHTDISQYLKVRVRVRPGVP